MPEQRPSWIDETETPAGSRWVRCALQVNPYGYAVRHGVKTEAANEESYNKALIEALTAADIELIAVTDHYRIAESETLLTAARQAGIVALPGFEASTAEGLHFLVIFDETATAGDVERCIGQCQVKDLGTPSPHGGISALQLLDLCRHVRAACVAAHVTQSNGLLKHVTGQSRLSIWTSENLHAVAIPGPVSSVPKTQRAILTNADNQYARRQLPAILNAGDIATPQACAARGASCQLRMSEPSQTALRHALLDPQSRVRLDSDAPRPPRPCLVAIHWDGGLLDGQTIPLAQELNVLIGAPGAGKSTVIESLRSAFELAPSTKRAREDHKGILEKVVRNGTTISVVVDHPLPSPVRYVIERLLPNPPVVRRADDWSVSGRSVSDLAPIPEIYGQHEIADLAGDAGRRTDLLHRFVRQKDARQREYDQVTDALERSRTRVADTLSEAENLEAELSLLPGARERLNLFVTAKVADRLAEQTMLDRELRVIERARTTLGDTLDRVTEFDEGVSTEALDADEGLKESPFLKELRKVEKAVAKPLLLAGQQAATLRDEIASAQVVIDAVFAKWKERRGKADSALQEVKDQLEAESIDYEAFRQVQSRVDSLEALQPKVDVAAKARDRAVSDRLKLLVKREALEAANLKDLNKAASRVSTELAPSVRIEVDAQIDHDRIGELLRKAGGRLTESLTIFQGDHGFSPRELAETARRGAQDLENRWQIPSQQALKIASLPTESLLELEEAPLRISTAVLLNTAPEDSALEWTPIEELSKGQQAIAVLLLLLLDSDAALIVDQPEDDLDNRFISSQVVPAVRQAKRQRQFVFSTHNANVPVLADAELVVGLTPKDSDRRRTEVRDEHRGALDMPEVRALVEQRLEGGRDAFEARRRRYRLD